MRRDNEGAKEATTASSEAAEQAGLFYVNDLDAGIVRRSSGKRFTYVLPSGAAVKDAATKERIRSLAIPPAWSGVWICSSARGHIQATGRDARGRKQYRYHPNWQTTRDAEKYARILTFAKTLPKLRKRIRRDMCRKRLDQRKVLATVVSLLETTLIRVGNEEYARSNGSFGLTTLKDRHVSFSKSETRFRFTGKTGKVWRLSVSDRRIARIVRSCQDLPGQHLFQYEAEGSAHALKSDDVNGYLRDVTGDSEVSAKDFRTWAGTVLAAVALSQFDAPASGASGTRNVRQAIGTVAVRLGNTPAICRKCYVHPEIVQCYLDGELRNLLPNITECALTPSAGEFSVAEKATLALLRRRLKGARRKRR